MRGVPIKNRGIKPYKTAILDWSCKHVKAKTLLPRPTNLHYATGVLKHVWLTPQILPSHDDYKVQKFGLEL